MQLRSFFKTGFEKKDLALDFFKGELQAARLRLGGRPSLWRNSVVAEMLPQDLEK